MKKIAVIYEQRDNIGLARFVASTIEDVFRDYAFVENYFLNELPDNFKITADAHVLKDSSVITPARNHLNNFDTLVILQRDINSNAIKALKELPAGTDVLVVNDTYKSSVEIIYALYGLKISHLNLFPYNPDEVHQSIYHGFSVAVTPGEAHLVPPFIKKTVDIGPREVSSMTLIKLMGILSLDIDRIHRNLIRHIKKYFDTSIGFHDVYLNNYLKSKVFNKLLNSSGSATIIVDDQFEIIFANEKAEIEILSSHDSGTSEPERNRTSLKDAEWLSLLGDNSKEVTTEINGEKYYIEKEPIAVMDEILGYYISLQNERSIRDIEQTARKKLDNRGLRAKYHFSDIVHGSEVMAECISTAKTAARTDHTVLITGESGTGKELVAQSIHNYSQRSDAPFVAINCAALPETLLESELFGYESGAFTGARKNGKTGLFEQAAGGTIFLDEIGDISFQMQLSLLRVLQEKQIMRIGGDSMISVDARVIAATNKNLIEEVKRGNFREDLFYRLNVITVNVPALAERSDDILPLMLHFLGDSYSGLSPYDKDLLKRHPWPGNVRELESVATYFETFKALPEYLKSYGSGMEYAPSDAPAFDPENIKRQILDIISSGTQISHGLGRSALSENLKERGIRIGDKNLRSILKQMGENGLITIEKGRIGMRITSKGYQTLKILSYMPK